MKLPSEHRELLVNVSPDFGTVLQGPVLTVGYTETDNFGRRILPTPVLEFNAPGQVDLVVLKALIARWEERTLP